MSKTAGASDLQAPWYNSNTAHQGEVDDMREDLEPILYEHGVDAVFAGNHLKSEEHLLAGSTHSS